MLGVGPLRRLGGWVLVVVFVAEAVRRGVLPAEDLSLLVVPDLITIELLPLGLLVPLLVAGAGAWLALAPSQDAGTRGPAGEDSEAGASTLVTDAEPSMPSGPPSEWPTVG